MRKRHHRATSRSLSQLAIHSLVLLCQRRLSASGLARALDVSLITAKRLVGAIREGGYQVQSVRRHGRTWFEVHDGLTYEDLEHDPFLTTVIHASATSRGEAKAEDGDYLHD